MAAFGLAVALAAAWFLGTPAAAWADEASTDSVGTSAISQGVYDALWLVAHETDQNGQNIQTEAALAAARQSDAADEEQALIDLNARGERRKMLMVAGIAQEREQQAAIEAAKAAAEDGSVTIEDDATPMAAVPTRATANKPSESNPGTLSFLGHEVAFAQGSCFDSTAPDGYASTWLGDGSVTDNVNTFFIGHNPGVFAPVMDLQEGDTITVCDENGNERTYTVFDTMVLQKRSNYFDYEDRLSPSGESITLQTCCPGDTTVRCVMAR